MTCITGGPAEYNTADHLRRESRLCDRTCSIATRSHLHTASADTRHSFALRWYSVGRLLYERQVAHLNAEEVRDFRAQFGDTWYLVKTLLGHADVTTTMDTYLEPFRDLDVSLLIEHAHGFALSALMASMFATHPQVLSDPLAGEPS
ncbi:hypothetical protein [Streptomyces sp. P17]|uniref:hypothetical protein n=1 Tax=Streptomyces sp. P17 TaxID=3074716 RepID=UPI0028F42405|nr:hypothetical protein [Streptomyces sp. P17]MDT9694821.1 hypothetical protein [Streptomyces sp. P17]